MIIIMGCQKQPIDGMQFTAENEGVIPKYRDPSDLRMDTSERGATTEIATYYLREGKRVLHGTQTKRGTTYVEQVEYVDGVGHGVDVVTDPEGVVQNLTTMRNGVKDGVVILWHPSGGVSRIECYRAGKLEGFVVEFWEDGSIKREAEYREGKLDGVERVWYSRVQDSPWYIRKYKSGVLHGKEVWWDEAGNVVSEHNYIDGERAK
ncbi:MAG: hypothetical protein H6841_06155 [Planctomycetes bacterium]|nr:hypothetical protein [Planctomycetota bacterium]